MRGIELPINLIIIIILAVIVLAVVFGLFSGAFTPGASSITLESAKNNACQRLLSTGCTNTPNNTAISNFDADQNGVVGNANTGTGANWGVGNCKASGTAPGDNLYMLCKCFFNTVDQRACARDICGCP